MANLNWTSVADREALDKGGLGGISGPDLRQFIIHLDRADDVANGGRIPVASLSGRNTLVVGFVAMAFSEIPGPFLDRATGAARLCRVS